VGLLVLKICRTFIDLSILIFIGAIPQNENQIELRQNRPGHDKIFRDALAHIVIPMFGIGGRNHNNSQ
jgi:hypothetical protein